MKSSPDKYVLAIDHGTSGCKTALVSTRGAIAGYEFEPTPIFFLPGGGAEQDPEDWWRAFLASTGRLLGRDLVPRESIVAVCCSSTFSSTVVVDQDGRHLMNALTWMDSRGAPHVRRLMRGLININGYGLSNVLRWVPRAGGAPTLSGKDDIAHLLYVRHELPEVYQRAHKFLSSKDYFNLRLSGQYAASPDSATLFWATDNRDIHNVHYCDGLIKRLGFHGDKLPPIKPSTEVLGPLLPEVAKALGLPRDLPVVVGSPDLQSACIGSGAVEDYEGHIYVGTSSWVLCHVPFKKTDMFHSIASLPSAIPGRYFAANEQDLAGGCRTFLIEKLLFHQNALQAALPPEDVHQRLDAIMEQVPAGSHKLIFTPWLNGERTPVDCETLRGSLHNISLNTTTDHIIRAVHEGVAYNTRWVLQYVERFIGRPMNPLNIIGGGARSDAWCRVFADVLDREIRQVEEPLLANARGAAFIAAVALGEITFQQIPDLVPIAATFQPNPANRAIYDEIFAEFKQIFKRTNPIYRRLNRPSS